MPTTLMINSGTPQDRVPWVSINGSGNEPEQVESLRDPLTAMSANALPDFLLSNITGNPVNDRYRSLVYYWLGVWMINGIHWS